MDAFYLQRRVTGLALAALSAFALAAPVCAGLLADEVPNVLARDAKASRHETKKRKIKIVEDRGWGICRAYAKDLSIVRPSDDSLACENVSDPSGGGVTTPTWIDLDVTDHLDVIYDIEKTIGGRIHPVSEFETWRETYLTKIRAGEIKPRLRSAVFRLKLRNLYPFHRRLNSVKEYEDREQTMFGYTRNRNNIGTCKQEIEMGQALANPRYTGDMLFYYDAHGKTYRQIFPDTGALFVGTLESRVVMYNSTVFLQYSGRLADGGYLIRFFRIFGIVPNQGMNLSYYAQEVCEITAKSTP